MISLFMTFQNFKTTHFLIKSEYRLIKAQLALWWIWLFAFCLFVFKLFSAPQNGSEMQTLRKQRWNEADFWGGLWKGGKSRRNSFATAASGVLVSYRPGSNCRNWEEVREETTAKPIYCDSEVEEASCYFCSETRSTSASVLAATGCPSPKCQRKGRGRKRGDNISLHNWTELSTRLGPKKIEYLSLFKNVPYWVLSSAFIFYKASINNLTSQILLIVNTSAYFPWCWTLCSNCHSNE